MNLPAIAIRKLRQVDNYHFEIEWTDGSIKRYRLSDVQKKCPCAQCVDEWTGERRVKEGQVQEDVRAKRLSNVGRYALRIEFTSGCSTGIYSYDYLYKGIAG